jgi:hypothetical protein
MPAPPLRSAVSGTPTRATANTGFGALYDYAVTLLGGTGNASDAQFALGVPSRTGINATGTWGINISGNAAIATIATQANSVLPPTAAQAEAGAENSLGMTALRVEQHMLANALGWDQTLTNVTVNRTSAVTYTNSTGRPILVAIHETAGAAGNAGISVNVNGSLLCAASTNSSGPGWPVGLVFVVPNGGTYSYTRIGSNSSLTAWVELR